MVGERESEQDLGGRLGPASREICHILLSTSAFDVSCQPSYLRIRPIVASRWPGGYREAGCDWYLAATFLATPLSASTAFLGDARAARASF